MISIPIPEVIEDVECTLTYDGPLVGGQSSHKRSIKNTLRVAFHRQLDHLCATRWDLRVASLQKLPLATLKAERLVLPEGAPDGFFLVKRGGLEFLPIYTQMRAPLIKVRIEIYRRQPLGG